MGLRQASMIVTCDADTLYLLGDVHGRWESVGRVLAAAGLVDGAGRPALPARSLLVQVGDLIDCGYREPPSSELLAQRLAALALPGAAALYLPGLPAGPGGEERWGAPFPLAALLDGQPSWPRSRLAAERAALLDALDGLLTLRLFRDLEQAANLAEPRLVCLLGDHECDLLRGGFDCAERARSFLLALAGLPLPLVARHAAVGLPPAELRPWLERSAELRWLATRPMLVIARGLAALHGGPPRALVGSCDVLGIQDRCALAAYLEAARAQGWGHPAFARGRSLLAPDRPEDDVLQDPALLRRFLSLLEVDTLAVGHSPYLHVGKGCWPALASPAARAAIGRPARLGPQGELLKLDTNLRRGGRAWLLRGTDGSHCGSWLALSEDGERLELAGTVARTCAARSAAAAGGAVPDAPPRGLAAGELDALCNLLAQREPTRGTAWRARLERCLHGLLELGWTELAPFALAARAAEDGDDPAGAALAGLEGLLAAAQARLQGLQRELAEELARAPAGAGPVLLLVGPAEQAVGGRLLRLAPAAARLLLAERPELAQGRAVITTGYFAADGCSHVELFCSGGPPGSAALPLVARLPRWPPAADDLAQAVGRLIAGVGGQCPAGSPAQPAQAGPAPAPPGPVTLAHPGAAEAAGEPLPDGDQTVIRLLFPPGPAVEDPDERALLEQWITVNLGALGRSLARATPGPAPPSGPLPEATQWELRRVLRRPGDGEGAGRFVVAPSPAGPWQIVLRLPGGTWVHALSPDPGCRFQALQEVAGKREAGPASPQLLDQARFLLDLLDRDPLVLYSAASATVEALLRLGELEALGRDEAERPPWQRGRYLFLSPNPASLGEFFHKQRLLRFIVPRDELHDAAAARLLEPHLYPEAKSRATSPDPRFGGRDIALEIVALGVEGIGWTLRFLQ